MATYETAHISEETLERVVGVINRSRRGLPLERSLSVDEFRAMTLKDLDFKLEGSWLATSDGAAVGYAAVLVDENRLSIGRDDAYFDLEVVPEERGEGLEETLLGLATGYIKSRGVRKARTRCIPVESWRERLLKADGFEEASRVYTLVRKGRGSLPVVPAPEGIRLVRRPFEDCGDDELRRITEAFNTSFKDHYNFAPERAQKFIDYRDVCKDPTMISLGMSGDDIAGVCLHEVNKVYNDENGTRNGWIGILGVLKPYRKRGIGRFLLVDSLGWLMDQGMDTVHISVYATNEKALPLYRSVGFEQEQESIWFEKVL